jgi:hypothetical protein
MGHLEAESRRNKYDRVRVVVEKKKEAGIATFPLLIALANHEFEQIITSPKQRGWPQLSFAAFGNFWPSTMWLHRQRSQRWDWDLHKTSL